MEVRVLEYFLAVAREQSITRAAEYLHLTQPTLSRQLKDLEDELGKQLFTRGSRKIVLTDDGLLLRKRAEEIVTLVRKTVDEVSQSDDEIAGDLYIGAGETEGNRLFARVAQKVRMDHPLIRIHIVSGDKKTVTDELDKGLLDFGLLFGDVDADKYDYFTLPMRDRWGVLMLKDSPLAAEEYVTAEVLKKLPLIISRQTYQSGDILRLLKCTEKELNIAATYNLIFNGSLMVEEGLGYALGFDKIINISGDSRLCFRPLFPFSEIAMNIVWKKYSVFSKAADLYLRELKSSIQ